MKFIYFGLILAYWHKIDTAKADQKNNIRRTSQAVKCTVSETHGLVEGDGPDLPPVQLCEDVNDSSVIYTLNGNVDQVTSDDNYESNNCILSLPDAAAVSQRPDGSKVINIGRGPHTVNRGNPNNIFGGNRRLTTTGQRKALVVRVTDINGNAPTQSEATMRDDVFLDDNNLKVRYWDCSNGQLDFIYGTGTGVNNGVITVTTSNNLNGATWQSCGSWASALLPNDVSYNHVMYICPDVVNFEGAAAWGSRPGSNSWYRSQYASAPIVQVHEVGHNLGHGHSGVTETYDDGSCNMGNRGQWNDAGTNYCFNAAKTWYNGWYSDYHQVISPIAASYSSELVGINNVQQGDAIQGVHDVVLKIANSGEADHYVHFNRREGANNEVPNFGDRVVVYTQGGLGSVSTKQADMGEGGIFTKSNWANSGFTLTIKVCSITIGSPDLAVVLVYLAGSNDLSCPVACSSDAECDDGLYCNGAETCTAGVCQSGSPVVCDDGLFCNGIETCNEGTATCDPGTPVTCDDGNACTTDTCNISTDACESVIDVFPCDGNGICEAGEDCNNSDDCIGGQAGEAVCGNNVCETADGEDCFNCPQDCNSRTGGKPANRYCCGDTIGCSDGRCSGDGNTCSDVSTVSSYCCGDLVCTPDSPETFDNCAIDGCSAPVPTTPAPVTPAPTPGPALPTLAPTKQPKTMGGMMRKIRRQ